MRNVLYLDRNTVIELVETRWPNIFLVKATELYIAVQALVILANNPDPLIIRAQDRVYGFTDPFERTEFKRFYLEYIADTLIWYRGFAGSHFSYPGLREGVMASEGDDDIPTFTMQDKPDTGVLGFVTSLFAAAPKKTRWLPGCFDFGTAVTAGHQSASLDPFTRQLMMKVDIPLTFIVRCAAGRNSGTSICWLNLGEQVIRGPIRGGDFRVCAIYWMKQGVPDIARCDLAHHQIPPARPYEPAEGQLMDWWKACSAWIDTNWVVKRGLAFTKLDLSGLPPPTYGVQ